MRKLVPVLALAAASALAIGCAAQSDEKPSAPAPSTAAQGAVTVDQLDGTAVRGSYTKGGERLTFAADKLSDKVVTVTLEFHGLTLDANFTLTDSGYVWTQDGFATANGEDTLMDADDVAFIDGFVKSFEGANPSYAEKGDVAARFGTAINYWGMWIPVMELRRTKIDDRTRVNSLCSRTKCNGGASQTGSCSSYDWYDYTGHDCGSTWLGGYNCNGDPVQGGGKNKCSSVVQLGDHTPWNGVSGATATQYYSTSGWTTSNFDHATGYEIGECYGRYGNGCGSGKAYNDTSLSHDQCVRNGHNIASSWCSDELMDTTDSTGNCY